ncbi:LOW QUALITY PROTEIN: uncharacterized protein LOC119584705 [Penaeus monodon]|uniref:LOW QUALITY PROTEIN: uncharacterized protein LOC119584705 n=1 Tax=Penaeus monodon TaxID=6687 RepID=UPI0018A76A9B|nr:LOW QUALITY PROTEIN: uncharacterized protein LOC119584705 [Penaeus monodon]
MVERCWRAWACALVLVGVAEGVASQRDLTLPLLQEEVARFPVFFNIPEPRTEASKRQSFSAWGGKRTSWHPALRSGSGLPLSLRDIYLHLFKQARYQPSSDGELKRASFSPWGGKRASSQYLSLTRSPFEDAPEGPLGKRPAFSPWGGKRSSPAGLALNDLDMGSSAQLAESLGATGKRVAFSPWGGKRSVRAAWGGQGDALALDAPEMLLDGDEEDPEDDIFPSPATVHDAPGRFKRMAEEDGGATPAEATGEELHDKNATRSARDTQALSNAATKWNAPTPALLERRAFSAWAGKRADGENVKRQAFSAWAGKRSSDDEKRQAFSAWAGKESSDDEKRQGFSAWAGKRASDDEKRQAFSAWAGKRAFDEEKRQAFSPWAGKRADDESKRQAFSPWAGKRDFSAWAGKRASEDEKRQAFSPWAGKRDNSDEKRQAFSPWAGKRALRVKRKRWRGPYSTLPGGKGPHERNGQAFSLGGKRSLRERKASVPGPGKRFSGQESSGEQTRSNPSVPGQESSPMKARTTNFLS